MTQRTGMARPRALRRLENEHGPLDRWVAARVEAGYTMEEIGREIQRTRQTVWRWLNKYYHEESEDARGTTRRVG